MIKKVDINWRRENFKIECCDCALVHEYQFVVAGHILRIIGKRDNRATVQKRRHRNITIKTTFDEAPLRGNNA